MSFAGFPRHLWIEIFLRYDFGSLDTVLLGDKCEHDGVDLPPVHWHPLLARNIDYRLVLKHRPFYMNLIPQMRPGMTITQLAQDNRFTTADMGALRVQNSVTE